MTGVLTITSSSLTSLSSHLTQLISSLSLCSHTHDFCYHSYHTQCSHTHSHSLALTQLISCHPCIHTPMTCATTHTHPLAHVIPGYSLTPLVLPLSHTECSHTHPHSHSPKSSHRYPWLLTHTTRATILTHASHLTHPREYSHHLSSHTLSYSLSHSHVIPVYSYSHSPTQVISLTPTYSHP